MADLITLQELLDALGKVPADMEDFEIRKYEEAIKDASSAIRNYADRDFTLNEGAPADTRTYEYDPSGYVDIDDAKQVLGVQINYVTYGGPLQTLTTNQWQAQPFQGPVKDTVYIYAPVAIYGGMSPQMGFTWNLDKYEHPGGPPPTVEVEALWGWEAIPDDVQRAAIWTSAAFAEEARQVTAESIEGFSRSMRVIEASAIPLRAREILDEYRRITV